MKFIEIQVIGGEYHRYPIDRLISAREYNSSLIHVFAELYGWVIKFDGTKLPLKPIAERTGRNADNSRAMVYSFDLLTLLQLARNNKEVRVFKKESSFEGKERFLTRIRYV